MTNALDFELIPLGKGATELLAKVDGVSLVEEVAAFEARRKYSPSGGYAGIIPAYFNFGDLRRYFEGHAERPWPSPGRTCLLGCDCGELGCWPLTAAIAVSTDEVIWSDFAQPHRPKWNYEGFGPFVFDRAQYADAVERAVEALV